MAFRNTESLFSPKIAHFYSLPRLLALRISHLVSKFPAHRTSGYIRQTNPAQGRL